MKNLIFAIFLATCFIQCAENKDVNPTIKTPYGIYEGVYSCDNSVEIFWGVPFAEPPVGNLRFQPPQKCQPFDGIKKCLQPPSSPMQPKPQVNNCWTLDFQIPESPISEDCLYLNIWRPAQMQDNQKLPVMVWIHGGGFVSGSGTLPIYGGETSAKNGVIFITLSYRVGIFGFLAHPQLTENSQFNTSGNYGILDQIEALKWIKENIEFFGGDKDNVIVLGQSAGAYSINALMVSPLAKNLFNKAILQSGGMVSKFPFLSQNIQAAENYGVDFCQKNGLSLEQLKTMPAEDLLKYPFYQGVTIDNKVVCNPREIFEKGEQNCKTIITGYTETDGCNFEPYLNAEKYKQLLMISSKSDDKEWIKCLVPFDDSTAANLQKIRNRLSGFGFESFFLAHLNSLIGGNSYMYFFKRIPGGKNKYGAFHSSEIAYVLGNLDKWDYNFTENDKKLSQNLNNYWINFAKNGNPNSDNLVNWPKFSVENQEVLNIDTVFNVSKFGDLKYCKIMEAEL